MKIKTALLFFLAVLALPLAASASEKQESDSLAAHPRMYAYVEAFGPAGFYSMNVEKLFFHSGDGERRVYGRLGLQWLPDLSARYTVAAVGGLNFDSGKKSWTRSFGAGLAFRMDRYNWKKNGELSSHCAENNCDPTVRWGPYLSLGMRYRFDSEMFLGFEFTPIVLSGNDGAQLIPYAGLSIGFLFDKF
jgi:hypothetical protein